MSAVPATRGQVTADDVPPAIQWHEGMLLVPQHFQQTALRHELLVHYHAAAAGPFHWGIRKLRIDTTALTAGLFKVIELEGVFPDGLIALQTESDPVKLTKDLTLSADTLRKQPLTVHLAVVKRSPRVDVRERYASVESDALADETTGEGALHTPVQKAKLELILGDDIAAKYVSFPIARVEFANGSYARTRYEPPGLRVGLDSLIYEVCMQLATRLREKSTLLAEEINSASSSDTPPQLVERKLLTHCLVGELPSFEAVLRSGVAHPFSLYVSLCSVLGHIAGLGSSLVPPMLAPYDHDDALASFEVIANAIHACVAEGFHETYVSHPFKMEGDEFRLLFKPEWSGRKVVLGVRAPSGVADPEMAAWVTRSIIASRSKVTATRDHKVTGAERKQIESDIDLVPPRGMTLYSVAPDPEFVQTGEDLIVTSPGDGRRLRPDSIVLFVRNLA
jgi:type VI secretion system protein ImpJ